MFWTGKIESCSLCLNRRMNKDVLDREDLSITFLYCSIYPRILLEPIYLFGFGVPLFIDGADQSTRVKWGLWIVHKLLLTAIYGLILFMHHSKWRERLPARPAFYNYICVMFLINTISLFSCVLMENGAVGFWLYGLITICYHSFYLPLLYMTFLADFFQEDDLRLENVYYSDMQDADWEVFGSDSTIKQVYEEAAKEVVFSVVSDINFFAVGARCAFKIL